jgi:predicted Zn-dependent peptidase
MVVSAAGNLAHAPLVELAEAAFATVIPQGDDEAQPAAYRGGDFREVRDLEQVQLILGFEGIAFDDADYYPLAVLSTLLGGGMSSRLFQEVREKRGLAYSIYSFVANYADGGLFGIHAGTGEAEVEELVPVVCEELARAREPASEQELSRARTQLKSGTLMSRESTGSRTEQAARQLQIYGRTVPVAEVVAKIDAVEAADVARIARRLFESPLTAAALGPVGKLEEYDRIAGRLR